MGKECEVRAQLLLGCEVSAKSRLACTACCAQSYGENKEGGYDGGAWAAAAGAARLLLLELTSSASNSPALQANPRPAAMLYLVAFRMPSHVIASCLQPARPHLPEA
eukprot:6198519-Pleurochrysis_carterae.AAC.1